MCTVSSSSITCNAVAPSSVKDGLGSYGNMDTSTLHSSKTSDDVMMRLCTFDYVRETNTFAKFGWTLPARGRSRHTWNIHFTSCDFFPSCLPSCLFCYCAPAQAKRIKIISRTMAQKTQFGVRKYPPSKCFSLIWRFGDQFSPNPQHFAPVGKAQPNKKSRIMS